MYELETISIKWPVYIPKPDDLALDQAAQAEAERWAKFYPKQKQFTIHLYVRFHSFQIGKRTFYKCDGVKANWNMNVVSPGLDCVQCGRAVFAKGE